MKKLIVDFRYAAYQILHAEFLKLKGSPDQSHFIFKINVGKKRIRHRTTLNLNDSRF